MFDRGRILRLAARYEERGKYEESLREYRKLVELDPGELRVLRKIAGLELRRGERAAAAEMRAQLGERLATRGWKLVAIYRYRSLLELVETLPEAAKVRFRSVAQKLEQLRAVVHEERTRLAADDQTALTLEQSGRDEELAALLRKMIAVQPDNPVLHARLAETVCRLGRVEDALPSFRLAAQALSELDRATDALRVLERILHFHVEPDDARFAAELYLERGEQSDAARAVAKLQPCIAADPESLDSLGLLARAFQAMGQPARAAQVHVEMMRIAYQEGETVLARDLVSTLIHTMPDDPLVRDVARRDGLPTSSGPAVSVQNSLLSMTDSEIASLEGFDGESSRADVSVLEELSFEELSEVWVMPVVSKEARRALHDAAAFLALRLYPKAIYVLRVAVDEDPVCGELREALRGVLHTSGDVQGYVEETIALADLYRQRRYFSRVKTLADEVLDFDPENEEARSILAEFDHKDGGRWTRSS